MNEVLIGILILNLIATLFVALKFMHLKSVLNGIKIEYSTDSFESDGLWKKQKKMTVKGQLYIGNIPVGHQFVVSEQTTEVVDKEMANRILTQIAAPFAKLGIRVATRKIL